MRKLNLKRLAKIILGLLFLALVLLDWLIILFIGATFTWFGIITNIIMFAAALELLKEPIILLAEKEE